MEQSTGDADNELSKTRDVLDQPTEPVDGVPGSSSELKEEAVQGDVSEKPSHSTEHHATSLGEVENNHDDTDKINCGSPIVISCTEVPHIENAKEGEKGSLDQDAPSSNVDKEAPKVVPVVDSEITKTTNEGKSFTFDVPSSTGVFEVEASKKWLPFSSVDGSKDSSIVKGSPSSSDVVPVESQVPVFGSPAIAHSTGRSNARGRGKATSESKTKRASGKTGGKGSAGKRNILKEPMLLGQLESGGKSGVVALNGSGVYQKLQSSETQRQGQVDCVTSKPCLFTELTPIITELKTSALPNALQQPFTDLQQVQLRAQILVYGSLISKLVPEEVHMMSAFGGPDGGRSMWEKAWRAFSKKLSHQTANAKKNEIPKQTQRAPTQAINMGGPQNKVASSPVGQTSSKNIQSPVVNPIIPFSSPLWNVHASYDASQSGGVPSPQHMLSPLQPNQAPFVGNYVAHGAAWTSQTPFHGPLVASLQTSAPEAGARLPPSPNIESVKLTSLRDSPLPVSTSMKNVSFAAAGGVYTPTVTIGSTGSPDLQKMVASPVQPSVDSRTPRKRKKASSSTDDVGRAASQSQQEIESIPLPTNATSHWAPVVTTTIGLLGNGADRSSLAVSQSSTSHHKMADLNLKKSFLTVETLGKVEEARLRAQDAETFASAAVSQSQELWGQLNKQKSMSFGASTEVKLASAAAAIAVAASVAKAAAAAATVASNAALQVKLSAEDALVKSTSGNPIPTDGISFQDGPKKGDTTSILIMEGDAAEKEAARRKSEVSSAASVEAENLKAVVKAAQLAAEAIAQAEKVISTGDSLPLCELIEGGLDGFWKMCGLTSHETRGHDKSKDLSRTDATAAAYPDFPRKHVENPLQNESARANQHVLLPGAVEDSRASAEKHESLTDGIKDPETTEDTSDKKTIKVGSHVEVFKDGDGYKAAWFPADVLSLEDGKAYVSYSVLQSSEGSGKLKEWVELGSEGSNAPRIRISHSFTATQIEGTRKRRRSATRDFTFSVGDKVDAWMQDSWWEGVVTEEDKKNRTTVTVHFPAHGKNSVIKAWQLRPSLIWKDGEWIVCSSTGKIEHSHREGDTPKQKRKKIGNQGVDSNGKDKVVETVNPQNSNFLGITDSDKEFNIGRDKDESKMDKSKTRRAGLRKHDARVVFGVPKPGKKQKFMEVSKHYVDKKSKKFDGVIDDSAKLANYLAPRATGPHERRNIPKIESQVKQIAKSKAKVLKSATVHAAKTKDSSETAESELEKNESTEHEKDVSDTEEGVKPTAETAEPRRSNRRIQPTSRLLEGLQSSLIGSKAPLASHERASKGASKTVARGK